MINSKTFHNNVNNLGTNANVWDEGSPQTWVVPNGVECIQIHMWGAGGPSRFCKGLFSIEHTALHSHGLGSHSRVLLCIFMTGGGGGAYNHGPGGNGGGGAAILAHVPVTAGTILDIRVGASTLNSGDNIGSYNYGGGATGGGKDGQRLAGYGGGASYVGTCTSESNCASTEAQTWLVAAGGGDT